MIPLTLLFLAQKRNLLIPLELSGVMHQGMNKAIAKNVGDSRKRPEWSLEEFVAATEALPGILNNLVRQIKSAQNG